MATSAYWSWVSAGRPFDLAEPIRRLRELARAHGVAVLGTIGNEDHLTDSFPEDHTPFSFTAWPAPLPGYIVTAIDLADGPHADRMLADAVAGRITWVKYINLRGKQYNVRNGWSPTSNSDQHFHLSIRSDSLGSIGDYNPFSTTGGMSVALESSTPVSGTATPQAPGGRNVDQVLGDLHRDRSIMYGEAQVPAGVAADAPVRKLLELLNSGGVAIDVEDLAAALALALAPLLNIPTIQQIEDAAFRGAQRAETQ
jgi:hypothetical protein